MNTWLIHCSGCGRDFSLFMPPEGVTLRITWHYIDGRVECLYHELVDGWTTA